MRGLSGLLERFFLHTSLSLPSWWKWCSVWSFFEQRWWILWSCNNLVAEFSFLRWSSWLLIEIPDDFCCFLLYVPLALLLYHVEEGVWKLKIQVRQKMNCCQVLSRWCLVWLFSILIPDFIDVFLKSKICPPLLWLVFTIVWGFCFQKIMLLVRCEHSCCYIIGHAHPYSW
jgi:hypothetical protein